MSNRCSVSSMNMLKTIYQRCVVRMRVYAIYFSMRLGDAIDPCHLANGFEAVISYECQERRAIPLSRIPRIQTSHARCDKASELVGGSLQCRRGMLVILWMSPFGETFHAYPRLIRWTFPQFIEREIELVTMVHSCLSHSYSSFFYCVKLRVRQDKCTN